MRFDHGNLGDAPIFGVIFFFYRWGLVFNALGGRYWLVSLGWLGKRNVARKGFGID
jgi:hypothetical protein